MIYNNIRNYYIFHGRNEQNPAIPTPPESKNSNPLPISTTAKTAGRIHISKNIRATFISGDPRIHRHACSASLKIYIFTASAVIESTKTARVFPAAVGIGPKLDTHRGPVETRAKMKRAQKLWAHERVYVLRIV